MRTMRRSTTTVRKRGFDIPFVRMEYQTGRSRLEPTRGRCTYPRGALSTSDAEWYKRGLRIALPQSAGVSSLGRKTGGTRENGGGEGWGKCREGSGAAPACDDV